MTCTLNRKWPQPRRVRPCAYYVCTLIDYLLHYICTRTIILSHLLEMGVTCLRILQTTIMMYVLFYTQESTICPPCPRNNKIQKAPNPQPRILRLNNPYEKTRGKERNKERKSPGVLIPIWRNELIAGLPAQPGRKEKGGGLSPSKPF